MKFRLIAISVLLLLGIQNSYADRFEFTGKVKEFIVNSSKHNNTENYLGFLLVEGFTTAGSCYSSGTLGIPVRNDAQGQVQASLILAATMSGKDVFVRVNDDEKDSANRCYLQQIRVYSTK